MIRMGPYRTPPPQEAPPEPFGARSDDRALACMFIVIGGARVIIAICGGETFHAEATIAAVMVVFGLGLLR